MDVTRRALSAIAEASEMSGRHGPVEPIEGGAHRDLQRGRPTLWVRDSALSGGESCTSAIRRPRRRFNGREACAQRATRTKTRARHARLRSSTPVRSRRRGARNMTLEHRVCAGTRETLEH